MTGERKLAHEPMLEIYVCETEMLLEHLEAAMMVAEAIRQIPKEELNHLLTEAHSIKSASAMMLFPEIASGADALEILLMHFEDASIEAQGFEDSINLVWEALDFIKKEVKKAAEGIEPEGSAALLHSRLKDISPVAKTAGDKKPEFPTEQKYYITQAAVPRQHVIRCFRAKIHFEKNCQMENIRAFTVVHNLRDCCQEIYHQPKDLISDPTSSAWIVRNGLELYFSTDMPEHDVRLAIEDAILIQEYTLEQIDSLPASAQAPLQVIPDGKARGKPVHAAAPHDSAEMQDMNRRRPGADSRGDVVSVEEAKLDKLAELAADILLVEAALSGANETENGTPSSLQHSLETLKILAWDLHALVAEISAGNKRFL